MSGRNSHGSGYDYAEDWVKGVWGYGQNTIIEKSVRLFNHRQIDIKSNVYIGHHTILKGYPLNSACSLRIGDGCWIGERCYFNAAGSIEIRSTMEDPVGIGPGVMILTSEHDLGAGHKPVIRNPLVFSPVTIEKGCDIGCGSIILPGVTIGEGAVVGAGSVVTKDVKPYTVVAGVPAKLLKLRTFHPVDKV